MGDVRLAISVYLFCCLVFPACAGPADSLRAGEPIHTFRDFPIKRLYSETDQHRGKVFEDSFKFYRIYHGVDQADPSKREQTVRGQTHFTARLVAQYVNVVRIQITPGQEKELRSMGVERQDVIRARVRFVGIAPDGALAFDLLEILP